MLADAVAYAPERTHPGTAATGKESLGPTGPIRKSPSGQQLALVHEWIAARAGSEKVFEALAGAFPAADLDALSVDPLVQLETGGREIRTTFLDHERLRNARGLTLPLMSAAWRSLGRRKYTNVITSHHALAQVNSLVSTGSHLVYVHSPARYIWSPEIDTRGQHSLMKLPRKALERIDVRASRRVTAFAANSRAVADRIERFWGRESIVIFPPVDVEFYRPSPLPKGDYILGVGRWIEYKRFDFIIKLGERLGVPVRLAGRGPLESQLRALGKEATVPVNFYTNPTDGELRDLYRRARALIFPTLEDFGIVPVEAQACGTPVIALAHGGALDTVLSGKTGMLVDSLDVREWADAFAECQGFSSDTCKANAARFSRDQFVDSILRWSALHGIA